MTSAFDEATEAAEATEDGGERAGGTGESVPALTIIWHPDVARVGQACPLEPLAGGRAVELTRLAPTFVLPGEPPERARGLEHRRLSRSRPALRLEPRPDGSVVVAPAMDAVALEMDGVALERPTTVAAAELARGVILTVARRIVLCLHRMTVPVVRGPALGLVGGGDGLERVRRAVARVADLEVPVLIRGETGTGKELVARAVVQAGPRAGGPLVAVNVAAVSASTAVAELFGHERGAFTGAAGARPGYFGDAAGGTLFLDEVGLTPQALQPMLLRALETGEYLPVGATRARRADVRVLAATDADLEQQMASGAFSEPLYHRLAGFQITVPPLRERREDFGLLLLHFLNRELATTGEPERLHSPERFPLADRPWLTAGQVAHLAMGSWPGNLRALRNAVRQMVIASRGEARAHIDTQVERLRDPQARAVSGRDRAVWFAPVPAPGPAPAASSAATAPAEPTRRGSWEIRGEDLLAALRAHRWRPGATAAALHIPRTTLYALMEKHPEIRRASDIPGEELLVEYRRCAGDLDALAERLKVSRRGLQLRLGPLMQAQPPRGADDSSTPGRPS